MDCTREISKQKMPWRFDSPSAFRLLLLLIWINNTVLGFVIEIMERLPIVGMLAEFIMPTVFIALTICAVPYILKHCHATDLFFYLGIAMILALNLMLYPTNQQYLMPQMWRILGTVVPLYFIGVAYKHDFYKKDLFWVSLLSVLAIFAYQIYYLGTGRLLNQDNMNTAYNVLPSVLYLIYWAFEHKKWRYTLLVLLGFILILLFGTRGVFLVALIFFACCIFAHGLKKKSITSKCLFLLIATTVIVFLARSDVLIRVARLGSELFGKIGFSTRIFDFFLEGNMAESKGRERLYRLVMGSIRERPLLGYGIMGDWAICGGIYVHNLFLELYCQFGIIVGSLLLIALFSVVALSMYRIRHKNLFFLVLMFACFVFVKLMLTGSYLHEPWLFFLLGLCANAGRVKKGDTLQ